MSHDTQCYPPAVKKTALVLVTLALLAAGPGTAATVEVTVTDAKGAAIADAVVSARPPGPPAALRKRSAAVEQRDKAFVPLVSVVQAGTAVQFPNRDPIRHHVYSFSPAKVFEIKLYADVPAAPVVFDKPGEVVLGCNIHDHMIAYIYVVDTPWYAKTGADGKARIAELPAGDYDVQVAHYAQVAPLAAKRLALRADDSQALPVSLALKVLTPRPAPQ